MILLASRSPQRALLLERAGLAFGVVASSADEELVSAADPDALALARARDKARQAQVVDGLALGADTVVALGERDFGKPRDRADAERILASLAGTTHRVITGHWFSRFSGGRVVGEAGETATTWVSMRAMSLAQIRAYVDTGESDGRAGAYAIQESGDRFVEDLDGAWDTVVGLHLPAVVRLHQLVAGKPPTRA